MPTDFDLEEHIRQHPPERYGFSTTRPFRKDPLYAYLSLLTSIPAYSPDLIDENGFIPIHAKSVSNKIKDITLHRNYLIATGIIETNGCYTLGVSSMKYRWAARFDNSEFEEREVLCRYGDEYALSAQEDPTERLNAITEEYPHIGHWLQQDKIAIDPLAKRYAWLEKERKMADTTKASWGRNDRGRLKYPVIPYQAAIRGIGRLTRKDYGAHFDDNIHRFHSVFTNIQKELRNFITYDGQQLVGVDITNCQPYLSCLLFNREFWNPESTLPLSISTIYPNIRGRFSESLLGEIRTFLADTDPENFREFIELVTSGRLYEWVIEETSRINPSSEQPLSRKDAKVMMFHLLFYPNSGSPFDATTRELIRFMTGKFPRVIECFRLIKKIDTVSEEEIEELSEEEIEDGTKPHARLSCLLQAIESTIVLHHCCPRIWTEGEQNIPVITIHDSIVTTVGNEGFVQRIMQEEFTRFVGYAPNFKIERWELTPEQIELLEDADGE